MVKIIYNCKRCNAEFTAWECHKRKYCSSRCSSIGHTPWNKGKPWSDEHKQKLSIIHTGKLNPHKGIPWTKESKEKVSKSLKKIYSCGKRIVSIQARENSRKRIIKLMSEGKMSQNDTLPERLFENQLLFNNIPYVKQYKYVLGIADFWLPETNTVVEVDGTYWHSKPHVVVRDLRQTEWLENNDYNVLRFTDKEILTDVSKCVDKVR